ncbi:hypothetical protein C6P72_06710 [Burkholderia gladioli]|nr:hypothetical protein C6P72_06710 [Burkholderia gladioli]
MCCPMLHFGDSHGQMRAYREISYKCLLDRFIMQVGIDMQPLLCQTSTLLLVSSASRRWMICRRMRVMLQES